MYSFFGSCDYKIICFSLKDFRQQSPTRARSKITITINSVYIRSVKKRELVNARVKGRYSKHSSKTKAVSFFLKCNSTKVMGGGTRTSARNLVIFFQESVKQKIRSLQQCASNGRKTFIWKLVLQKGTSSHCVLFIHKLSKHDHGAAESKLQARTTN